VVDNAALGSDTIVTPTERSRDYITDAEEEVIEFRW